MSTKYVVDSSEKPWSSPSLLFCPQSSLDPLKYEKCYSVRRKGASKTRAHAAVEGAKALGLDCLPGAVQDALVLWIEIAIRLQTSFDHVDGIDPCPERDARRSARQHEGTWSEGVCGRCVFWDLSAFTSFVSAKVDGVCGHFAQQCGAEALVEACESSRGGDLPCAVDGSGVDARCGRGGLCLQTALDELCRRGDPGDGESCAGAADGELGHGEVVDVGLGRAGDDGAHGGVGCEEDGVEDGDERQGRGDARVQAEGAVRGDCLARGVECRGVQRRLPGRGDRHVLQLDLDGVERVSHGELRDAGGGAGQQVDGDGRLGRRLRRRSGEKDTRREGGVARCVEQARLMVDHACLLWTRTKNTT
jgi:hypothetical protein